MTKRPIATNASGAAKKSASAVAAAQKREAQRKQLMEMKRKNKMAMSSGTAPAGDAIVMGSNHAAELGAGATAHHDEGNSDDKADR